ncbi:MAG: hypothetical protein LJF06_08525 [Gemmatimonadetes bacterium]|nr:hypothetical protein [Gemmatimonadota bacterium]
MNLTRRELIRRMGLLVAGSGMAGGELPAAVIGVAGRRGPLAVAGTGEDPGEPAGSIPLIHVTDLYDPPQDPDDQIDLATVVALEEYDVLGVVLDITEKFLHARPEGWDIARKPGFESVAGMARITGRTIPVAQGPHRPLSHPGDTCENAPEDEQAGIRMILRLLEASRDPVTISVTGSPRALIAAYNREPALLREKILAVLLNAGSTGGSKVEWNVQLDPRAYVGLWRSDLRIRWYPPGTDSGAFDAADERGTYYRARQADLFRDLPVPLQGYFADVLAGSVPGGQGVTGDDSRWRAILSQERNLWSTASLVMGAGRVLAETEEGWRFLPARGPESDEVWPWRLDRIRASVDDEGRVDWAVVEHDTGRWIFGRRPGRGFGPAMTEALNALLRDMKVRKLP